MRVIASNIIQISRQYWQYWTPTKVGTKGGFLRPIWWALCANMNETPPQTPVQYEGEEVNHHEYSGFQPQTDPRPAA